MVFILWCACVVAISVAVAGIIGMAEMLGYRVCSVDTDTMGAYRDDYD